MACNSSRLQGIYGYDGLGRRVESKEAATTTFYAYHGTETLSELAPTGTSTDYVYADGMRVTRMGYFVATNYYHIDALGSTRLVTDANGNVVFSDSYQPYGQDNGTPTGTETYKFTGKPVSQTTGLYYDYQRWYDPSAGRFINQDSNPGQLSDPQSLNVYSYSLDSPSNYFDPDGASPIGLIDKALAGLSLFVAMTDYMVGRDIGIGPGHFKVNPVGYKGDIHAIWLGYEDKSIEGKFEGTLISKFDRPSVKQPYYHIVRGEGADASHIRLPEFVGRLSELMFDHPVAVGGGLVILGAVSSGYDIYTAYQQGPIQGETAVTREVFSRAGAMGGAEAGAAICTLFAPGVGTLVCGFAGGVLGGQGGEQLGGWVAQQLFEGGVATPGWINYGTPVGRPNARPI